VEMEACMTVTVALTRSRDAAGNVIARLALPLADEYFTAQVGTARASQAQKTMH
jgi:hypothetical protein